MVNVLDRVKVVSDEEVMSGDPCIEVLYRGNTYSRRDRPLEFAGRPLFGPDFRSLSYASAGRD